MRRHRCRGLVAGLLLLSTLSWLGGCAPTRRRWPARLEPDEQARVYGVLWLGTPLRTAPRRAAQPISLLSSAAGRQPWSASALAAFAVIGEREGWVELETLGEPARAHCASGVPSLEPFRLRLFAPAGALVPVTAREVERRFDDGTAIALSRGVPLEPLPGTSLFRARLGSFTAVVQLHGAEVGTRYLPSPRREEERPPVERVLSADALQAGVATFAGSGRLHADLPLALPVYAVRPRGGSEVLAEVRPRCARLEVRVPAHVVAGVGGVLHGGVSSPAGDVSVRLGAPVFWSDGRRAGEVTQTVGLSHEAEPRHGRRCFEQAVRPVSEGAEDPSAWLTLCFERRDVVDPDAPPSSLLDRP